MLIYSVSVDVRYITVGCLPGAGWTGIKLLRHDDIHAMPSGCGLDGWRIREG
ncbi:MAG: hypothetical protein ACMUIS_04155 [bacterium]